MSATSFGLYLGHLRVCQYKNLTKEGIIKIPPIYLKKKKDQFNTVCTTHFVRVSHITGYDLTHDFTIRHKLRNVGNYM